jgi:hypothetical protein
MSDPPEDRRAEDETFDPAWPQEKKNAWAAAGAKAYRERQAAQAAAKAPDFDDLAPEEIDARDEKAHNDRSKLQEGKPRLKIERHSPDLTVTRLRDIMSKSGRLYDRGAPVRVVFDQALGGSKADTMAADDLVREAHFACQPYILVKAKEAPVELDTPLPPQIARMYLGWRGEWNLPPLNGIATTPLLSEDGSIRTARGYDAVTGLWCERVPDIGGLVPLKPTRSEAEAALAFIRDAFKTFCFADAETIRGNDGVSIIDLRTPPNMDESSFLCALLGAVCRPSLWLAPGSLFRAAPHSGSGAGKGKLVRCICAVAYERQPSAVTAGGGAEEMEKRISAALLEGGPAVLFDNFNNVTLRSASLESALTERPAKVRQFRTLDLITLNALASVFVTGNGVLLAQDIVRRFIPTEFDARMEDPERRKFSGDILDDVSRRRPELLAALLTIWRHGRLADGLKQGVALGSYEQWCAWVRDPLLTLGCRDPVERIGESQAARPVPSNGRRFVRRLLETSRVHPADRASVGHRSPADHRPAGTRAPVRRRATRKARRNTSRRLPADAPKRSQFLRCRDLRSSKNRRWQFHAAV